MTIREITPEAGAWALLPGAQFADAFRLMLPSGPDVAPVDALTAARRMMATSPAWVRRLMALRNVLVAPLGLKTPEPANADDPADADGRIGIFPILSSGPERVVLGMADKHLDFRAVVDVHRDAAGCQVTATTVVRTHNWLGRAYLAAILPFHRLVVRSMLGQVAGP
ncbi:DUF2867 domain-containing protein [Azospirillum sp. B4]|uniref:DUF2867 domain-containing protein n=1 Tax=Azospirillum sp. B4 TaxID=95605 RepID=UPI000349F3B2|nr:DUF2867 domain-containing protein [Azospirillum sp. B4]